ncbi:MAG: hypothetical protein WAQ53_16585 [Thiofilum sp.]|uniref:hypothetical protein n=1 Tax=Thiofilum sp. TaxID=2212733 RepID=UPI0025DD69D0|nr:hypothetical protein [Thiofilum sp.]MBK8452466.1 hypothetical protein [Thiofilum sp.]
MLPKPLHLFLAAQAFCFSNARGRCFSPGLKALILWYSLRVKAQLFDRQRLKRLRFYWEAR